MTPYDSMHQSATQWAPYFALTEKEQIEDAWWHSVVKKMVSAAEFPRRCPFQDWGGYSFYFHCFTTIACQKICSTWESHTKDSGLETLSLQLTLLFVLTKLIRWPSSAANSLQQLFLSHQQASPKSVGRWCWEEELVKALESNNIRKLVFRHLLQVHSDSNTISNKLHGFLVAGICHVMRPATPSKNFKICSIINTSYESQYCEALE